MAKLVRRVSSRISEHRDRTHRFHEERKREGLKNNEILCTVVSLDDTESKFHQQKNQKAVELYNKVFALLDLHDEQDYFALQYVDKKNIKRWLDPTKLITAQCKAGPPFHFDLRVRFYASEPARLTDELARYFFVCQLKEDIREGRLDCDDDVAVELAALTVQSDVGDFREEVHDLQFISSYRFLPEERQTEDFEEAVLQRFRSLKNRNINPATADRIFLDKVKALPEYGIDKHTVVGKDGRTYTLGIIANGILLYQEHDKIGLFTWEKMPALEFNGKKLRIVAVEKADNQETQHEFIFHLDSRSACKHLWKCCMEHHCFFRLREAPKPPSRLRKWLFRTSSRFSASMRHTQYTMDRQQQSRIGTGVSGQRSSTRLQRKPTRRYSARESFRTDSSFKEATTGAPTRSNTLPVGGGGSRYPVVVTSNPLQSIQGASRPPPPLTSRCRETLTESSLPSDEAGSSASVGVKKPSSPPPLGDYSSSAHRPVRRPQLTPASPHVVVPSPLSLSSNTYNYGTDI